MQPRQSNWATGVDYSSNTGAVDFFSLGKGGYSYAIGRALYGLAPDSSFAGNYAATRKAGMERGGYQFARPKLSTAQVAAKAYVDAINAAGGFDGFGPIVDAEYGVDTAGMSPKVLTDWVLAWIAAAESLTGMKAMLYTSPAFLVECLQPDRLAHTTMWIAQYGVSHPTDAGPITTYKMWQHTAGHNSQLKVPGILPYNDVDLNVFAGTKEELVVWLEEVKGVQQTTCKVNGVDVPAVVFNNQTYPLYTALQHGPGHCEQNMVNGKWEFVITTPTPAVQPPNVQVPSGNVQQAIASLEQALKLLQS